jgi:thiol-disulfide isomerase/thioredoxin
VTTRRDCLRLAATGLAAGLGMAGAGPLAAADAPAPPAIGDAIRWPAIRLMDGQAVAPPVAVEAAYVVVFFSTTCPFCARHNAHVQKLHEQAQGKPLRVLGMAHDRDDRLVRTYLQRRGLGFDTSMDAERLRPALTALRGIPLTCVVDRQQRLREVIRGEMFESDVLGLLKWARA